MSPEPPGLDVDELPGVLEAAARNKPTTDWERVVGAPGPRRHPRPGRSPGAGPHLIGRPTAKRPSRARPVLDIRSGPPRDRTPTAAYEFVRATADGTVRLAGAGAETGRRRAPGRRRRVPATPTTTGRRRTTGSWRRRSRSGPIVETARCGACSNRWCAPYQWPTGDRPTGRRARRRRRSSQTSTRPLSCAPMSRSCASGSGTRTVPLTIACGSTSPCPSRSAIVGRGQFAVVERAPRWKVATARCRSPRSPPWHRERRGLASVLLDQVTEYEGVVDGRELALTVLRSIGLISRNANPYREDPAGPEIPISGCPTAWPANLRVRALPAYRRLAPRPGPSTRPSAISHPLLAVRGTGPRAGRGTPVASRGARDRGRRASSSVGPPPPGRLAGAAARRGARRPPTEAIVRGGFHEARRRGSARSRGRGPAGIDAGSVLRLPLGRLGDRDHPRSLARRVESTASYGSAGRRLAVPGLRPVPAHIIVLPHTLWPGGFGPGSR